MGDDTDLELFAGMTEDEEEIMYEPEYKWSIVASRDGKDLMGYLSETEPTKKELKEWKEWNHLGDDVEVSYGAYPKG